MARRMEKSRTTVIMDRELKVLAKKAAIDRGITFSEFLEKAVKGELRGQYA